MMKVSVMADGRNLAAIELLSSPLQHSIATCVRAENNSYFLLPAEGKPNRVLSTPYARDIVKMVLESMDANLTAKQAHCPHCNYQMPLAQASSHLKTCLNLTCRLCSKPIVICDKLSLCYNCDCRIRFSGTFADVRDFVQFPPVIASHLPVNCHEFRSVPFREQNFAFVAFVTDCTGSNMNLEFERLFG